MSTEDKKTLMMKWFDALNLGDIPLLEKMADEFFTADSILHDPGFPDLERGPAGVKKFVHQILAEPSDMHITMNDFIVDGDKAATRFTVTSTNPATGKKESILGLDISRFEGGKIAEEWELGVPGSW